MGTEENKTVIRRLANIVNSGDLSSLDELIDENVTYRSSAGEEANGLDEFKEFIKAYQEAFSNIEVEPENIVAEGDKVFFHYWQRGTHTNDLMGIPASNNKMEIRISSLVTIQNGKIVEGYDTYDMLDLLKQLDALPKEVEEQMSNLVNLQGGGR